MAKWKVFQWEVQGLKGGNLPKYRKMYPKKQFKRIGPIHRAGTVGGMSIPSYRTLWRDK